MGYRGTPKSDHLDHLIKLTWVELRQDRLSLTELGRALLADAERTDVVDSDGAVVVLDSEDPFAYGKLIAHLVKAGDGLLIDPYFRVEQLLTILIHTDITRVLLSKQHKGSREDRTAIRVALSSAPLPRNIEIRASSDDALHDRLVVGENGVWLLGASLNSVLGSSANTMMISVPESAARTLREFANKIWNEAEPVEADVVG